MFFRFQLKLLLMSWFVGFTPTLALSLTSLYELKTAENQHYSVEDIQKIEAYFFEAESKLPARIRQAFQQPISVQFLPLSEHVMGRASLKKGIILNEELLPYFRTGSKNFNLWKTPVSSQYSDSWTEALGTLIHETAHLYDFMNIHSPGILSFINDCQLSQSRGDDVRSHLCEIYQGFRTTISTDPQYLEIAGWPLSPQGENYRKKENLLPFRSVDGIELKNPYEHFAANFEHYLLEPEFRCRKPTLARYFDQHFGTMTGLDPLRSCHNQTFVDPSATRAEKSVKTLPLDRVYQIHLLHAGPGSQIMSNWGHSMFRVVICEPNRTTVGPECLKDEHHHLVLSFRAFVNTPAISSWKGLTGHYPSRLFFVPFDEVKRSYLDIEGRDLFSYPLKLSTEDQTLFLKRALEIHWTYDSRYYFLSNNCAVESLNLLKSLSLNYELLTEKVVTPNELIRLLDRYKILERPNQAPNELLKKGLVFQNRIPFQTHALQLLTGKKESHRSLKEFYALPFEERKKVYENSTVLTLQQKAAILALEEIALEKYLNLLHENILTKAFDLTLEDAKAIVESYMKSISFFNVFSAPHEFLKNSRYGIPSISEIQLEISQIEAAWQERKNNDIYRRKLLDSLMGPDRIEEKKKSEDFIQSARLRLFETN